MADLKYKHEKLQIMMFYEFSLSLSAVNGEVCITNLLVSVVCDAFALAINCSHCV